MLGERLRANFSIAQASPFDFSSAPSPPGEIARQKAHSLAVGLDPISPPARRLCRSSAHRDRTTERLLAAPLSFDPVGFVRTAPVLVPASSRSIVGRRLELKSRIDAWLLEAARDFAAAEGPVDARG